MGVGPTVSEYKLILKLAKANEQRDALLAACEAAMRIETLWGPVEPDTPNENYVCESLALSMMRDQLRAAIALAKETSDAT